MYLLSSAVLHGAQATLPQAAGLFSYYVLPSLPTLLWSDLPVMDEASAHVSAHAAVLRMTWCPERSLSAKAPCQIAVSSTTYANNAPPWTSM